MKFQPKSEKQIQDERFPVLDPGKYHFEIVDATEEVSKKGNPMIVLKLKILDQEFSVLSYLKDYLMESIAYKLRHAAYACNLGDAYESGVLTGNMFNGKTGTLDLGIQKDKTGQYPDKNSVQDYICDDKIQIQSQGQFKQEPATSWEDNIGEPPPWVK